MDENFQENQTNQPEQVNRKGMSPAWIVILIIIALALGAAGGYYYFKYKNNKTTSNTTATTSVTPTSTGTLPATSTTKTVTSTATVDPTAGWKTFSNSDWNYSIKYPQNYYYEDLNSKDANTDQELGPTVALIIADIPNMNINGDAKNGNVNVRLAIQNAKNKTLSDFVDSYISSWKTTISGRKEISIGTNKAIEFMNEFTTSSKQQGKRPNLIAIKDNYAYILSSVNDDPANLENAEKSLQIMETLRFTK
ncbi:MAG: hypothetical protein M1338_04570 [Patescibacteria group bacterium]|nr:hypothetical protein [Patescibacteria group bacterium]